MHRLQKSRLPIRSAVIKITKPGNKVYKQIQVDKKIFDYLHLKKGDQTWDQFFENIKIYLPEYKTKTGC